MNISCSSTLSLSLSPSFSLSLSFSYSIFPATSTPNILLDANNQQYRQHHHHSHWHCHRRRRQHHHHQQTRTDEFGERAKHSQQKVILSNLSLKLFTHSHNAHGNAETIVRSIEKFSFWAKQKSCCEHSKMQFGFTENERMGES